MLIHLFIVAIVGYLIGSVNLSIVLSKLMGKGDIRQHGSGNAGTTNTLRVLGVLPAIAVLLFDIFKGVLAILLSKYIFLLSAINMDVQELEITFELSKLVAGFMAIMGHNFPIYYEFKGGKGVATSLGVIMMLEPRLGIICLIFALVLMISTRMVSFGSVLTAVLYPVLVITSGHAFTYTVAYATFACLLGVLIIYKHSGNIERIFNGTERRLWKTKREKALESSEANKGGN